MLFLREYGTDLEGDRKGINEHYNTNTNYKKVTSDQLVLFLRALKLFP